MAAPRLPRPPRWVWGIAAIAWLGLLAGVAGLDDDKSFGPSLVRAVLTALATVAFPVAGLGALLEVWQRREWRRRNRYVALDLYEQTVAESKELTRDVMNLFYEPIKAIDPTYLPPNMAEVFELPLDVAQKRAWHEVVRPVGPTVIALQRNKQTAQEAVERRNRASRTTEHGPASHESTTEEVVLSGRKYDEELRKVVDRYAEHSSAKAGEEAGPDLPTAVGYRFVECAARLEPILATRGEKVSQLGSEAAGYADGVGRFGIVASWCSAAADWGCLPDRQAPAADSVSQLLCAAAADWGCLPDRQAQAADPVSQLDGRDEKVRFVILAIVARNGASSARPPTSQRTRSGHGGAARSAPTPGHRERRRTEPAPDVTT